MDFGYITILTLLLGGVAFGLFRKKRPEGKKSNAGWVVLFVLAVPIAGLVLASTAGNEGLTWLFGLSLMVALPLLMFFAIGSAVGSILKRDKDEKK